MLAIVALKRTPPFRLLFRRDFRLNAFVLNKITNEPLYDDPAKKVFYEKLKEYRAKSKNGEMVEPTPEMVSEYKRELERINKQYGGDGKTDLTKFPEFKFPDVQIDPIVTEPNKPKS